MHYGVRLVNQNQTSIEILLSADLGQCHNNTVLERCSLCKKKKYTKNGVPEAITMLSCCLQGNSAK